MNHAVMGGFLFLSSLIVREPESRLDFDRISYPTWGGRVQWSQKGGIAVIYILYSINIFWLILLLQ